MVQIIVGETQWECINKNVDILHHLEGEKTYDQ